MERKRGVIDMHSVDPTGCEISERVNNHFYATILNNGILRERLALAEGVAGHQTEAMAKLFRRDNKKVKDLVDDKHIKMQEKIMAEKKRMVGAA